MRVRMLLLSKEILLVMGMGGDSMMHGLWR